MKVFNNEIPIVRGDAYYIATATAELKKRVEVELTIPDPPREMARAILQSDEEAKRNTTRAS